jgi:hypothetical protein
MTQPNIFGRDLASVWTATGPDLDSGFTEATGIPVLIQRLIRRITTPHGSVQGCPNDCIDVRNYLGAGITNADAQAIQSQIQTEWLRDQGVLSVQVTAQYNSTTNTLIIKGSGMSADGPFSLTLEVSRVTVDILNMSANG